MHIAFITVGEPARRTGGYLYHAAVFARLRARGHAIDEISASGAAREEQAARAASFGAAFEPARYDLMVVDALARVVCSPHLDRWRAQRPLVAMVHELPSVANGDEREHASEAPLLRADLLITVSSHGKRILENRGVPSERIWVISPGYDRIPATTHSASRIPHPSPTVLCVAQWIPRKQIGVLIEAWARKQHPARLELIGETDADPGYSAEVHAAIARANDPSIVVRGAVDDWELASAYASASLFALPSRYEGYGMVYAEAMSYGLPVIACDIGPLPELVGNAGLLVPPRDPAALAHALDTLLANAAQRHTLARAARARAATLPTWNDAANEFEGALHTAVVRVAREPPLQLPH